MSAHASGTYIVHSVRSVRLTVEEMAAIVGGEAVVKAGLAPAGEQDVIGLLRDYTARRELR